VKLRTWREIAGLTQPELADAIARHLPSGQTITRESVSRYENGARIPDKVVMRAIKEMTKGAVTANDFYD